ncbi:uracil-DNA glycosylase [Ilumatobacter coccineus]|uniref:uracil-DNA glycosylase n=1 Tax=Ilumatobacter coccineus TaxID=467094 RepID=UPI00059BD5A7
MNLLSSAVAPLVVLQRDIHDCRACPRLVEWRERVAVEKRAAFRDDHYWGKPISGFGDPAARIVILGLAPAAHGANRTGRMFTGDRSGDWLFRAMHRAGLANQAESVSADDGLALTDAWVTSAVKCAPPLNKPTIDERDACQPFLVRELGALTEAKVIICLGTFGFDAALRHFGIRPKPKFGHGVEVQVPDGPMLLGCYHVSQQNTFTKRLTEPMLDDVFARARTIADGV